MKKYVPYLLLAILFAALLMLSSCGEENYPFTAPADLSLMKEFWFEGYGYGVDFMGEVTSFPIYARKGASDVKEPVCRDPLCDHVHDCPATLPVGTQTFLAVVRNRREEICLYFTDSNEQYRDEYKKWKHKTTLYRLNLDTMTKTAIVSEMTDGVSGFWLYKNDIYLTTAGYGYDEETDRTRFLGYNVWKVPADGGELKQIARFDGMSLSVVGIAQADGRTVFYWIDVNDDYTLYVSPEDFSEKTKLADRVLPFGCSVMGSSLIYAVERVDAEPPFEVEAIPGDGGADEDGMRTVLSDGKLADYYKRDMTDPDAEPALLYGGASSTYGHYGTTLWAEGDTIYVVPYAPKLAMTIDAREVEPETDASVTGYYASATGGAVIGIDLATGERWEIPTPGFDADSIFGFAEGKLYVYGLIMDRERIIDNIRGTRFWQDSLENGVVPREIRFIDAGR